MILSCHHISKAFLEHPVLTDVTFGIEKGEKTALVGINGAGKTTLLRIIMGEMEPDSGTVTRTRDLSIGYLAQNQNVSSENTILQELMSVKQDLIDMEKKISGYEARMASVKGEALTALMEEYTDLMNRFERRNGYTYRGEVNGVLRGLGFSEEESAQKISTLSGGQKTRVALGKLLLTDPDLIILDEPTNHLDIASIQWLEGYLLTYRGSVLIVSHDRYFLDRIVSHVIELENTKATEFTGNYSTYAAAKQKMRSEQMHAWLNNQAEIKHQLEVITKLRQFNREKSIKRAESREKMLDKMEILDKPAEVHDEMRISLTPCIKSGREVLHVENLGMSFGSNFLFSGISFDLRRSEHVALIGDNGTGKTTMLKIINGLLEPLSGTVRTGVNVHIGYYDQEHHVLTDSNTVFEEIGNAYPDLTDTKIRSVLASFLFTGEDVFKRISELSGGEKGRVSLAKLMLSEANFLILDEPTNHLDLVSKEVLEDALNSYEGTVLYVSHDRYFINRTASRILDLTRNVLLSYPGNNSTEVPDRYIGNYDFYLEKSAQVGDTLLKIAKEQASASAPAGAGTDAGSAAASGSTGTAHAASAGPSSEDAESGVDSWKAQKEEQARLRKQAADLKKCEDRIAALEERGRAIDEEMCLPQNVTNVGLLSDLSKEKASNAEALETLYHDWEVLSE
jgi:ATP-binding cassette subfamily F protein 3